SRDSRLRLQLADVLALAGKGKEAVPILLGLADEFALEGFAAKAISVLKKVQKIDPSRRDVEARLAQLIQGKARDAASGSSSAAGPEGGGQERGIAASTPAEPTPALPPPPAAPAEEPRPAADLQPDGLAEFQHDAEGLEILEEIEPESETPIDSLGDELLGVIE